LAYGAIPLCGRTGRDPEYLSPLDPARGKGNAVIYDAGDHQAFGRAIQQALGFLMLPSVVRRSMIRRIMQQAVFDLGACGVANAYIDLYETVLACSLIAADPPPGIVFPPANEPGAHGGTQRRRKSKRSHRFPESFSGWIFRSPPAVKMIEPLPRKLLVLLGVMALLVMSIFSRRWTARSAGS